MHVLLFPMGSSGDVHPLIGLGLSLKQRGHQTTICTSGYFKELIDRVGLDFLELGTKEQFLQLANHPDLWHPFRSFSYIFRNCTQLVMKQQYEMIADHHVSGETMVISSCLGFGARIAQEKLGVPMVTVHLQPAVLLSEYETPKAYGLATSVPRPLKRLQFWLGETLIIDRAICKDTNAFRATLGLPPMKHALSWWHSPDCIVGLFPDWYAPPQPDWPSCVHLTHFPMWDERGVTDMPEEVEQFLASGPAPIAFTPGSAMLFGERFFETAVKSCQALGKRGVLLTRFPDQIPANLPDTIKHFSYVPFSQLLPHCAATVHHGGIGSTSQGLAAGIPQLIMPMAHDQPDNATRLKKLGVGDWLRPSAFRPGAVTRKLDRLLQDESVLKSAQTVAGRFSGRNGLSEAAQVVEEFSAQIGVN